jgi:hypothetical protein
MGKYDPSRCEFGFEIYIYRIFREVANCDARSALGVTMEMEHLNPLTVLLELIVESDTVGAALGCWDESVQPAVKMKTTMKNTNMSERIRFMMPAL